MHFLRLKYSKIGARVLQTAKRFQKEENRMTFPKAHKGSKKIFLAQLLTVIGTFVSIFTAFISIFIYALLKESMSDNETLINLFVVALPLLTIVVTIIGFLLAIIGILNASGDDENFKVALYSTLFGVILSILSVFLTNQSNGIGSMINLLIVLTGFLSTIYVIQGIRSLALKLNHPEMDKTGNRLYTFFSVLYVLQTFGDVAILVLTDTDAMVIAAILQLFIGVLALVQYIFYLLYLAKAKKMLAEN